MTDDKAIEAALDAWWPVVIEPNSERDRMRAAIAAADKVRAEGLDELWQELVEKDDRTSPAEYPDMALITREELFSALDAADERGFQRGFENTARSYGACMSCLRGAPEPFGCTDCLNTGYAGGAPSGFVSEKSYAAGLAKGEAELAEERATREIERDLNDDQLKEAERIIGVRGEEIAKGEADRAVLIQALEEAHMRLFHGPNGGDRNKVLVIMENALALVRKGV